MRYVMPEFSSERSEQLAEASFLAGKGKRRTPDESRRYEELKLEIGDNMFADASTEIERELWAEMKEKMANRLKKLEAKIESKR